MANDYTTAALLKAQLPDTTWGAAYDTLLGYLATRASRAVDAATHREPGAYKVSADTTRYFDGSGRRELWIGELAAAPTTVSMTVTTPLGAYTALASTDYYAWPFNAAAEGRPYLRLDLDYYNGTYSEWYPWVKGVEVVGKFGYSQTAPDLIVQAAEIQAVRWFKRAQQAFSDAGAIAELGQLRYVQKLDPDVALIISDFNRTVV